MAYRLWRVGNGVIRLSDMASIPECNDNTDWREYLEWLKKGNTPEPAYTPEEIAEKQKAEQEMEIEAMIQAKIREMAIAELKKEGKLTNDFK
jgi:hypothetical protein